MFDNVRPRVIRERALTHVSRGDSATHHFWEATCIAWAEGAGVVEVVDRAFNGVP